MNRSKLLSMALLTGFLFAGMPAFAAWELYQWAD